MKKNRILIFIEAFYPGWKSGGPTQSVKNIIYILKDYSDVYVVNRCRDVNSEDRYPGINVNEWICLERFSCKALYLTDDQLSIRRFREIIVEIDPKHIYINSLWNVNFSIKPLLASYLSGKIERVILNPRGELNPNAIAFKSTRKRTFVKALNISGIAQKIHWNATNDIEANLIYKNFGENAKFTILPNIPRQNQVESSRLQNANAVIKLVFLSRISRMKNIIFMVDVLKKTKPIHDFELSVYGPIGDKDYFKEFQNSLLNIPDHVSVSYIGPVLPDQVLDVLGKNDYFVLPTLGENFGHAIFDAWSAGLPVLISDQTPWLNLQEKKIGWDLPLSEEVWVNILDGLHKIKDSDYNDLSKSSLNFAVNYRYESGLVEKVKNLFE